MRRRHTECTTEVTQHFADELVEFVFVKLRHAEYGRCARSAQSLTD